MLEHDFLAALNVHIIEPGFYQSQELGYACPISRLSLPNSLAEVTSLTQQFLQEHKASYRVEHHASHLSRLILSINNTPILGTLGTGPAALNRSLMRLVIATKAYLDQASLNPLDAFNISSN